MEKREKTSNGLSGNDLWALCFLFGHPFIFMRGGSRKIRVLIFPKEKRTTNRRDPGGRRKDEIFNKWFIFLVFNKKTLCGLCALCG